MLRNKTAKPDLEIALCSRCASIYFNSASHWIERADMKHVIHEECMFCKNPHGYSFRIWKNANVQTVRTSRIRTFEEGNRDE